MKWFENEEKIWIQSHSIDLDMIICEINLVWNYWKFYISITVGCN